MTVQFLVEYLRDQFDKFWNRFASGTATVAQGNTTQVVTHSLGVSTYGLALTPLADPGGTFWASGKSATQFTINLQTAAPIGGISFDWLVKGVYP